MDAADATFRTPLTDSLSQRIQLQIPVSLAHHHIGVLNVFRRFREVVLQRSDARQILIDYWMGHSNASMGDRYGRQLVEDIEYRQEQVKKVWLGFERPPRLFGLRGLQIVENVAAA